MTAQQPSALVSQIRMTAALGDVAGLRDLLRQAAVESPGLVLLAQALILLDQQRPADALTILYAIDHLPGDVHSTALTAIGRALIDQGQPQQAITRLRDVLRIQAAGDPSLLTTLARAFFHRGDLDLAETLLTAVLATVPRHEDACYGMGIVRLQQGRLTEAIQHLQHAQQINPRRREPYRALARAWRLSGQPQQGAQAITVLMREHPLIASPDLAWELVELYAAAGDVPSRIRWIRHLEDQAALTPSHRVALGRHWFALRQVGALQHLLVGLKPDGEDKIAGWLLAGMIEELENHPAQARAFYEAAAQQRPRLWFAQERAATLTLSTDPSRSLAYLEAAEAAAPQVPEVHLLRALHDCLHGHPAGPEALRILAHHHGLRAEVRGTAMAVLQQLRD